MHALVARWPSQAAVIAGFAARLVGWLAGPVLPPWMRGSIETVGTLLLVIGAGCLLTRALVLANRRLLWRVRRKLIISYIFIGVVPAILIAVFFLLAGLLLFSTFSSYLVQSRLTALTDTARAIATTVASDLQRDGAADVTGVLERRRGGFAAEFPGVSFAVVPMERVCGADVAASTLAIAGLPARAGPWPHVDPPGRVPAWVPCQGFSGLLAYETPSEAASPGDGPTIAAQPPTLPPARALARAVVVLDAVEPGWAIVVDLPVDGAARLRLRAETGVEVTAAWRMPSDAGAIPGRPVLDPSEGEATAAGRLPFPSILLVEFRDWSTGVSGQLSIATQLSVGQVYGRIAAAQGSLGGRSLSDGLLLALLVIGLLFLVIESAALAAGLALARSITRSVHELFLGTQRVQHADFSHKVAVTAHDQLGALGDSFNSMTSSIEDLLRQAAEKKRVEEELRIAHEIQMSLLPRGELEVQGLSVTAVCVPAREVGGDYYDVLPMGDHRVGVLVADVAGKGTSAALYMAELKGVVLSLSRIHSSPRALLIDANRIISAHLDSRSFITMTYAVIDLSARTITYARAGHTPIVHLSAQRHPTDGVQILLPDGLALGLRAGDSQLFERLLAEETLPIRPGDLYLLFTDGITEAMNASEEFFGELRLGHLVEVHGHLPLSELRERILREVAAFVGETPQHDDMTMILLRIEEVPTVEDSRQAAATAGGQIAGIQ